MRPIVVATDGSDVTKRAVGAAASAAGKLDIDLWIVHVMEGFSEDVSRQFDAAERSPIGDALEAIAGGILTAAKSQAESGGAKVVHLKCRSGDCTEGILDTVREAGAAAIFVGRRGRGRLSGLLLGSVSQKLASLAPCMVVIVP
jgi:nucleotide-binding universal stress UspA family protein